MDNTRIKTMLLQPYGRCLEDFEHTSAELLELIESGRLRLDGSHIQALQRIVDHLRCPEAALLTRGGDQTAASSSERIS